jgi:hypothetical protein
MNEIGIKKFRNQLSVPPQRGRGVRNCPSGTKVIAMRGTQSGVILGILGIAVLAVLIVDLFAPVRLDLWLLYLPLCIATLWIVGPTPAIVLGSAFSVFIVAGLFFAPPDMWGNPSGWCGSTIIR